MRNYDYRGYMEPEPAIRVKKEPVNPLAHDDARMLEAIRWAVKATSAIVQAGGTPDLLLKFPDDLITTMIRNGINLSK